MNEEMKKQIEELQKLEKGFYFKETEKGERYYIRTKYSEEISFGKNLKEAMLYIAIRNRDIEKAKKALDDNHELWEEIFSDSAEDVEIIEILDSRNVLCKVSTEHGNIAILRVTSYVVWDSECVSDAPDGWAAWKITPW